MTTARGTYEAQLNARFQILLTNFSMKPIIFRKSMAIAIGSEPPGV